MGQAGLKGEGYSSEKLGIWRLIGDDRKGPAARDDMRALCLIVSASVADSCITPYKAQPVSYMVCYTEAKMRSCDDCVVILCTDSGADADHFSIPVTVPTSDRDKQAPTECQLLLH